MIVKDMKGIFFSFSIYDNLQTKQKKVLQQEPLNMI